jgi:hypothetical protein
MRLTGIIAGRVTRKTALRRDDPRGGEAPRAGCAMRLAAPASQDGTSGSRPKRSSAAWYPPAAAVRDHEHDPRAVRVPGHAAARTGPRVRRRDGPPAARPDARARATSGCWSSERSTPRAAKTPEPGHSPAPRNGNTATARPSPGTPAPGRSRSSSAGMTTPSGTRTPCGYRVRHRHPLRHRDLGRRRRR